MSVLSDELKNDPESRGYRNMKPDQIERDLNELRYDKAGVVPIGAAISLLYNSGTFDAIFAAMMSGDKLATAALEKIKTLKVLGIENIDCSHPKALSDMLAAGVPQADIDAITALGTMKVSRAQVLGIDGQVGQDKIRDALV